MPVKVMLPMIAVVAACAWALAQSAATGGADAGAGGPGKLVFEETFDKGLENWTPEGPHVVEVKDGRLHVKTADDGRNLGQFVWCRTALPKDFRIEFDVTPASASGFFLIFFNVEGVKGEDILGADLFENYLPWKQWKPYQDWDKYTSPPKRKHESRIRCYHASYRRNEQANCNLRKNPGLNLVKSNDIEALLPKDKPAHVALTKLGARIRIVVNGREFMDWTDDKDAWSGGRFGFRQVYESEGNYDNVKLYDLTKE